jgi:hypothetical protein
MEHAARACPGRLSEAQRVVPAVLVLGMAGLARLLVPSEPPIEAGARAWPRGADAPVDVAEIQRAAAVARRDQADGTQRAPQVPVYAAPCARAVVPVPATRAGRVGA